MLLTSVRSSRPGVFCRKGVLRNFAKFKGKLLCQSLFFNKVAGVRPAILFKKRLWHRCFPLNFAKFLRTPFFTEHLQWLLLFRQRQKSFLYNFQYFGCYTTNCNLSHGKIMIKF